MKTQKSKRFLVVGMQRSGTTVVHQVISGHSRITTTPREVSPKLFYDFCDAYFNTNRNLFTARERSPESNKAQILAGLFETIASSGVSASVEECIGLKVATGMAAEAKKMVDAILEHAPELHIIHVERKDVVAACASFSFAEENRRFQIHEGEELPTPKIEIEREFLLQYIVNWKRINAEFERLSDLKHYSKISFEAEIASGQIQNGEKLFDFLGLEPEPVEWVTLQKSLPSKQDTVTNLEECESIATQVIDAFNAGASIQTIYDEHGPSLISVVIKRVKEFVRHPATVLRRSYWRTLSWKLTSFRGRTN
ncbi:MAG: sulfotransferase [Pseudomonadota bacterium]